MKSIFVDTSYWITLLDPHDELHEKATAISASLGSIRFVTSEMVLTELLNFFSKYEKGFREAAVKLIKQMQNDPNTKVIPQTSIQFKKAVQLYSERSDKKWSLTDCASFRIMEKEGIKDALTYDKHFEQAGFSALLRDENS